ncbi:hypothetical protein ACUXV3_19980 (plasmid) [Roseobacteraceae bacterium NS-SX3]
MRTRARQSGPARGLRLSRRMAVLAGLALCAAALGYMGFKTWQMAGRPGYDFRYIWLAGQLWLEGTDPYGAAYQPAGTVRIAQGHVPEMWVYPPSWWPLAVPFGALGLQAANVAWNLLNILLLTAAAGLAARGFARVFPGRTTALAARLGLSTGSGAAVLFCLTLFLLAVLEATGILFSVGQTTALAAFGLALMLPGREGQQAWGGALGLALLMLKPQIGLAYAVLLLLLNGRTRRMVLYAVGISGLLALPALLADPAAPLGFLRNVAGYDGFTAANLPHAQTGLRLILWELTGTDIGNMAATGAALAAVLAACCGPLRLACAADSGVRAWQRLALATALILALAPLHIYDFVLIVVLLPLLLTARGTAAALALAGGALIWRSENLAALTGFHAVEAEIFAGARLATLGALMVLAAVALLVRQMNAAADAAEVRA